LFENGSLQEDAIVILLFSWFTFFIVWAECGEESKYFLKFTKVKKK